MATMTKATPPQKERIIQTDELTFIPPKNLTSLGKNSWAKEQLHHLLELIKSSEQSKSSNSTQNLTASNEHIYEIKGSLIEGIKKQFENASNEYLLSSSSKTGQRTQRRRHQIKLTLNNEELAVLNSRSGDLGIDKSTYMRLQLNTPSELVNTRDIGLFAEAITRKWFNSSKNFLRVDQYLTGFIREKIDLVDSQLNSAEKLSLLLTAASALAALLPYGSSSTQKLLPTSKERISIKVSLSSTTPPTDSEKSTEFLKVKDFNCIPTILEYIHKNTPVIMSLEGVSKRDSQRIIDFIGGANAFSNGTTSRVSESIYLIAPKKSNKTNEYDQSFPKFFETTTINS